MKLQMAVRKNVRSKPLFYELQKPQCLLRRKALNFQVDKIFSIIPLLISVTALLDNELRDIFYFEFMKMISLYSVCCSEFIEFDFAIQYVVNLYKCIMST